MKSHYREITVMATDITATGGNERAAAPLEVYGRAANGQFLPRIALANNLLKSVNIGITNIQVNVARPPDLTPVFDALRALPQLLQDKALQKNYRAVLNHYENYLHHGDELYLKDVLVRCATEMPDFESALGETLKALAPDKYEYRFTQTKLEPLKSLCNSYLGMLAYNFHAVTIYHPDTAADETVIQGFIERAIDMLSLKLREILMPENSYEGSLYLEAFHEVDSDRFERYRAYDGRSVASQDIRKFVAAANTNNKYSRTISLDKPSVDGSFRQTADTLIELIDRFHALLCAKKNYHPQTNGESGLPINT